MHTPLRTLVAAVSVAAFAFSAPVSAQQKVRIGFISTFSGPQGVMGQFMKESVELAIDHLGGKVGGLPVEMFYGDDQLKPDVGVQVAEEMLKKNQVDFVSGIIWSNVMMAVVPVVTGANKIMVGTNAGASPLAGKDCNRLYFSTSWNNDQTPEAMGKFLTDQGVNDLYVMAPNYQAGKDMVAGLKRYYKGRIVEEVYTKLGQQDYQAEISQLRAKSPKAVFAFYPGGMGIQFIKQYDQAGLRGQLPLYTVYTVDEISIPAVKDAAVGIYETRYWSPDLKNPANNKFVADYKKKYGKLPVFYGAQSYDGIMLIDSAIKAVKGNLSNVDGMVKEMEKANFRSLRGPFTYNVNHHPIQNFYLLKTEKLASGDIEMRIQKTIFEKHKDSYFQDCKMK
ncbi:MAG TPA: ABC transporter substrate-binding protein [Burkholderiales bacterium]|nr:ABC transporter substrate-binding protein [Burkholderiales bacterium]